MLSCQIVQIFLAKTVANHMELCYTE